MRGALEEQLRGNSTQPGWSPLLESTNQEPSRVSKGSSLNRRPRNRAVTRSLIGGSLVLVSGWNGSSWVTHVPLGCVHDRPYGTVLSFHSHAPPGTGDARFLYFCFFESHGFFLFQTIVVDQASFPCLYVGSAQSPSGSFHPTS